jgi:hypothetical protein
MQYYGTNSDVTDDGVIHESSYDRGTIEYQDRDPVPVVLAIYRLERVIIADMLKSNAGRCLYDSTIGGGG